MRKNTFTAVLRHTAYHVPAKFFFPGNPGYSPIARRLKNLKQVSYPEVSTGLTRATKQLRPVTNFNSSGVSFKCIEES